VLLAQPICFLMAVREFLLHGSFRSKLPYFRSSAAPSGQPLSRCDFGLDFWESPCDK